jgi:putative nucleotidyltransferase with HDIG domain
MNLKEEISKYGILNIIGAIADENNIKAYAVGGFVRDIILTRKIDDIDIVCLGKGIFLAEKVAKHLHVDNFAIYARFGTAMFKYNNLQIEFVGARKESYDKTSRKPIVEEGTFEDDQLRRDFTINTLAIALNKDNFGELINYLHGLEDLQNKIIKTPIAPRKTFSDDPLRMLRAIRFATQLNFTIDINTFEAIKEQKERIKIISQERIRDEINKILLSPRPSVGFKLLSETGLLALIMPLIENLKGKLQIGRFSHKDIFVHTLQVVDNVSQHSENIYLRWTALLHDIAKPQTKKFNSTLGFSFHGHEEIGARMVNKIFSNFKLPKDKVKYVEKLIRLHLRPITIAQDVVSDSGVRRLAFESGEDFNDLMLLCRADITSHNPQKINEYLNNFDKVEKKVDEIIKKDFIRNLQPVITGEMIMKEFKLPPGPKVGKIKQLLKNAILNGEVENEYEKLYEYLNKIKKDIL